MKALKHRIPCILLQDVALHVSSPNITHPTVNDTSTERNGHQGDKYGCGTLKLTWRHGLS